MRRCIVLFSVLLFLVGCTMIEKAVDLPDFVQESDFKSIDWDKKAVEFGDRGIIGNSNKSGVIGVDMPSLNTQKWMWNILGIEEGRDNQLTIVGYHKEF